MKLNCLSCGHMVDLHADYDDYEGQVKCYVCDTMLTIRTEEGHIKRVVLTPHAEHEDESRSHSMSS